MSHRRRSKTILKTAQDLRAYHTDMKSSAKKINRRTIIADRINDRIKKATARRKEKTSRFRVSRKSEDSDTDNFSPKRVVKTRSYITSDIDSDSSDADSSDLEFIEYHRKRRLAAKEERERTRRTSREKDFAPTEAKKTLSVNSSPKSRFNTANLSRKTTSPEASRKRDENKKLLQRKEIETYIQKRHAKAMESGETMSKNVNVDVNTMSSHAERIKSKLELKKEQTRQALKQQVSKAREVKSKLSLHMQKDEKKRGDISREKSNPEAERNPISQKVNQREFFREKLQKAKDLEGKLFATQTKKSSESKTMVPTRSLNISVNEKNSAVPVEHRIKNHLSQKIDDSNSHVLQASLALVGAHSEKDKKKVLDHLANHRKSQSALLEVTGRKIEQPEGGMRLQEQNQSVQNNDEVFEVHGTLVEQPMQQQRSFDNTMAEEEKRMQLRSELRLIEKQMAVQDLVHDSGGHHVSAVASYEAQRRPQSPSKAMAQRKLAALHQQFDNHIRAQEEEDATTVLMRKMQVKLEQQEREKEYLMKKMQEKVAEDEKLKQELYEKM
eukprot:g2558.t1